MSEAQNVSSRLRYRLRAAWNVLRGRPTVYGCHLTETIAFHPDTEHALVSSNHFDFA